MQDPQVMLERSVTELRDSVHRLRAQLPALAWPDALQQFTVIQGRCTALIKLAHTLQHSQQPLHRQAVVVAKTASDPDDALARATDGRVHVFDTKIAPEVLRSRHTPETEQLHASWAADTDVVVAADGQLARLGAVCAQFADSLQREWAEWAAQHARAAVLAGATTAADRASADEQSHLAALRSILQTGRVASGGQL